MTGSFLVTGLWLCVNVLKPLPPSPVFKAGAKDKRLIPSVGLGDFGDEGRRLR